jgi:integrase
MSRAKYQRPEVYQWKGRSGEKFWKAEWRQYIEGRPKPKHRAATWPCKDYSKAEAQKACDSLVQEETCGPERPDGSMTVREFWEKVYWPIAERRVAPNTRKTYRCSWNKHVEPFIGKMELQHVSKHAIAKLLDRMADAGKGKQTIQTALVIVSELFRDAMEGGYIDRNPVWRIAVPRVKARKETRPMTEAEVRRLFAKTEGLERLWWRIVVLTGARIGEVLALAKSDLLPGMLRID